MTERLLSPLRIAITFIVIAIGALIMLLCAVLTLFSAPRFYRESIGASLGKAALCIWGIRLVRHGGPPTIPGQYVYISNHTSTIDMFVLIALGLPNTRFFLSGFLRNHLPIGLIGYLMGIFWTVSQDRPQERTLIFQNAERVLRQSSESVYLSPEGERITSGNIGHFNKGAFHLATALRAPIIPMFIHIPHSINPGRGWNAKPGCVEVYFAPMLETRSWRVEDVESNRNQVRNLYVSWHRELIGR